MKRVAILLLACCGPLWAQPTSRPVSALAAVPASLPAVPDDQGVAFSVSLLPPGQAERAVYWLALPAGYKPGAQPALLVVLHGTDDNARQMIDFWGRLSMPCPVILAAPQGVGRGWCDRDPAAIRAMFAHLNERVSHDSERVLLAGFSAGGAMGFHLLYKEKSPVTALAALANYVPPSIASEEIRARSGVPVFYAVGMDDLNHERMRWGLSRLRDAGGDVFLHRPRIGHVLDPVVGQAALDWFFKQTRESLDRQAQAAVGGDTATALPRLETVLAQARWHDPASVDVARQTLERIESPGREQLRQAKLMLDSGRKLEAAELLLTVETRYAAGRLGREAGGLRLRIEDDPEVRRQLAERRARRRADEAFELYRAAQMLVAQNRLHDAAERCRQVTTLYQDTPSAPRAKFLLDTIEQKTDP